MTIEQWLAVFAAGRDVSEAHGEPWATAEDALDVCGVVLLAGLVVLLVLRGVA